VIDQRSKSCQVIPVACPTFFDKMPDDPLEGPIVLERDL
jgi:hypothetical protein